MVTLLTVLLLLIFGLIALASLPFGFIFLYRYLQKYNRNLEAQLRSYAKSVGARFWKGSAIDTDLRSIFFEVNSNAFIRYSLAYDDATIIGQADTTVSDSVVIFDFATVPLDKYKDLWLIVDSRSNNLLGRSLMDIAEAGKKLEKVVLEGNFPQSYKVYMNAKQQIDALTALNPASMQKLLDLFKRYDMEICDGRVYVYTITNTENFYDPKTREQMMRDVKQLAEILR